MDFEDVLVDVGDYGKYQKSLILIYLIPSAALLPWFSMNILFMVSVPNHWCHVPELVESNLTMAQQRYLVSPEKESCKRYDLNYTDVLKIDNFTIPNGSLTVPCDRGWQYDKEYYDSTVVTVWDLVCDSAHLVSLILTMFNVGSIIGTPIYGALSDKIGRKITFFITVFLTAASAISSVFMTDFTAFVVIKTINGSIMPCVFQLPFIIILEIVSPEMRTRMNGLVNISWTVGLCCLPLLAYYTRGWVLLGLITSSVSLIFLLYWRFLPESPRWLVSMERYEDATDIMCDIAKKNSITIDRSEIHQKLQKLGEKMKDDETSDGTVNSPMALLQYPQLRKKFIIITCCWMADIMAYYGLQLNIANLAGNEFINHFLLAIVEIPGYITSWIVMEKFGRRWCAAVGFMLTGCVCMLQSFDFPYGDVICSMMGKYFAAATFMATYQQSSELYPTVVRSLGMGMSSTVASVVTLVVPYVIYLGMYGKAIPFVIIGMSGIVAGIMAMFLPETLNEHLPQSIHDCENFGKHQKFFSWNRRRHSLSRERASQRKKSMEISTIAREIDERIKKTSRCLDDVKFVPGNQDAYVKSGHVQNNESQSLKNPADEASSKLRTSKDSGYRHSEAVDNPASKKTLETSDKNYAEYKAPIDVEVIVNTAATSDDKSNNGGQ